MSASGTRFFGPLERRALALSFACTACFSIDLFDDLSDSERTAARYIEKFCSAGSYELEGSAELTTGLTDDSCGFSVGPADGVVRFIVPSAEVSAYDTFTFSALVASEDGTNPRWINVGPGTQPVGAITFSVGPRGGEKTRIIDVRIEGSTFDSVGCSIATRKRPSPGAARTF